MYVVYPYDGYRIRRSICENPRIFNDVTSKVYSGETAG